MSQRTIYKSDSFFPSYASYEPKNKHESCLQFFLSVKEFGKYSKLAKAQQGSVAQYISNFKHF